MKYRADYVIIGSGAGGATVAMELAKTKKEVLIVEKGDFADHLGTQRKALKFYDRCGLRASKEGIIIYRALMAGGTTVVSCGSGIRVLEEELGNLGIRLSREFEETEKELGIKPLPKELIGPGSRLILNAANDLGLEMEPMPKFINPGLCTSCGKCVLGCRTGAKWSSLLFLERARQYGAKIITKTNVRSIVLHNGKAIGLVAIGPKGKIRIYANKIILSAGGVGSPVILKRSGIENAGKKLFADLFNVTYGILDKEDINLWNEPTMAVFSKKYMKSKGFIVSPFIDVPLVLRWVISKREQLKNFKYKNLLGIMVKTRDENIGNVTLKETFEKKPSQIDSKKLDEGSRVAEKILTRAGVKKRDVIFTKPRGAHPGGSAAIGEVVDKNLETKIKDLYVCDASVLPTSPGAPPIVTIVSLGKRLSRHLLSGDKNG